MFGALMASYLLQPPSFSQLLADELSCGDSLLVERRLRLIKANDAVAVQLAANRRGSPTQPGCNGPLGPTGLLKGGDLVSFFLDEMAVAHAWQTLLGGVAPRVLPHPIHLPLRLPVYFVVESAISKA